MKLRILTSALGAVVGLGMLAAANSADAAKVEWSMAAPWGGGPFLEEDAKGFAKTVKFLTEGRVNITVFPAGTLGSALKVTDTVKSGVAQVGHNWMGYDWGIDKTTVVFSGYAGGLNPEEFLLWLYEAGGKEMWRKYRMEKFGVVSIPCGIFPTEIFLHSRKKIQTLADFKGLKMRTAGAWAEIAGNMGASTVILPGAEVYGALERGVVDATEWSSPSINKASGFHKVAKYIIMPGVHQPAAAEECEFNKKAWDSISERDQKLIEMAAELNSFDSWKRYAYRDVDAYHFYVKSGNEMVRLTDKFQKTAREEAVKWADEQAAKNKWFAKVLAHQRAFQKNMKAWPEFRFATGARQIIGK